MKWQPIIGTNYECNHKGEIRHVEMRQIIKLQHNPKTGRPFFQNHDSGNSKTTPAAPAICAAWHGPRPSSDHLAIHRNGNAGDVRVANLQWATRSEALRLSYARGRSSGNGGNRHMTQQDIRTILRLHARKWSQAKIAAVVKFHHSAISKFLAHEGLKAIDPIRNRHIAELAKLEQFLRKHPQIPMRVIGARLKHGSNWVRRSVRTLEEQGRVVKEVCTLRGEGNKYTVME